MLDKEREFYAAHLQEWVGTRPGKFAVIKDDCLVGFFDNIDDALTAGASRFGLAPFLVRQVGLVEETVTVPALTLGLLRADP